MDVKDYIKYCLFVEEVGHQLEQRALDGGELPPALRTRAPGAYPQSKLGLHVICEPPGRFGPTPHIPAVFPVRTVRIPGKGDVRVPEVAAVRVIISLLDTGIRMVELLEAIRSDAGRFKAQDSYKLTLPHRPRTGEGAGPTLEFKSMTAWMLTRELEVRQRTFVDSPLAFARLDGLRLTPREVTRAKTAMWEAFLLEFGIPRTTPRPNPRVEMLKALRRSLGHMDLATTSYYAHRVVR